MLAISRIRALNSALHLLQDHKWEDARRDYPEIAQIGDSCPEYDSLAAVREIVATGIADKLRAFRDKIPEYWLDLIASGLRVHFANRYSQLSTRDSYEALGELLSRDR